MTVLPTKFVSFKFVNAIAKEKARPQVAKQGNDNALWHLFPYSIMDNMCILSFYFVIYLDSSSSHSISKERGGERLTYAQ